MKPTLRYHKNSSEWKDIRSKMVQIIDFCCWKDGFSSTYIFDCYDQNMFIGLDFCQWKDIRSKIVSNNWNLKLMVWNCSRVLWIKLSGSNVVIDWSTNPCMLNKPSRNRKPFMLSASFMLEVQTQIQTYYWLHDLALIWVFRLFSMSILRAVLRLQKRIWVGIQPSVRRIGVQYFEKRWNIQILVGLNFRVFL
jgi:hypothetical protein